MTGTPADKLLIELLRRASSDQTATDVSLSDAFADEETIALFALGGLSDAERRALFAALDVDDSARRTAAFLLHEPVAAAEVSGRSAPRDVRDVASGSTSDVPERLQRARLLLELGRVRAARHELEVLIADRPEDALAWRELGRSCRRLDDLEAASQALQRAIQFDPANPTLVSELADVLEAQARPREALELWQTLLSGQLTVHQRRSAEDSVRRLRQRLPSDE